TTGGGDQGRSDAVTGRIAEADCEAAVGQGLPIKVIAAGLFGGLIPTGDVEAVQVGRATRKESLLDRTRNIEIVVNALQLALELCLAQCGENMVANLSRYHPGYQAPERNHAGVAAINQRKVRRGGPRPRIVTNYVGGNREITQTGKHAGED